MRKNKALNDLPDPPQQKKNPIIRIGLAVVVAAALVVGGLLLVPRDSQSPDEKATALATTVVDDVLVVIAGDDVDGSANARIKAAISEFDDTSGCKFVGGTVTFGSSSENATAVASKYIYKARQTPGAASLGDNLGVGYSVIPTRGLIRGEAFIAAIAAVDCSAPAATGPAGGIGS